MAQAEGQTQHRQGLENRVINAGIASERRAQWLGASIAMIAIIGGFFLIWDGKSPEGLAAIVTPIAALVGVFLYGKNKQQQELQGKRGTKP